MAEQTLLTTSGRAPLVEDWDSLGTMASAGSFPGGWQKIVKLCVFRAIIQSGQPVGIVANKRRIFSNRMHRNASKFEG